MFNTVALTLSSTEIFGGPAKAEFTTAIDEDHEYYGRTCSETITEAHQTFNGHSFPDVLANFPHSAVASQFATQPDPQYVGP